MATVVRSYDNNPMNNANPTAAVRVANQVAYATGVALRWVAIGYLFQAVPVIGIPVLMIAGYRAGCHLAK